MDPLLRATLHAHISITSHTVEESHLFLQPNRKLSGRLAPYPVPVHVCVVLWRVPQMSMPMPSVPRGAYMMGLTSARKGKEGRTHASKHPSVRPVQGSVAKKGRVVSRGWPTRTSTWRSPMSSSTMA